MFVGTPAVTVMKFKAGLQDALLGKPAVPFALTCWMHAPLNGQTSGVMFSPNAAVPLLRIDNAVPLNALLTTTKQPSAAERLSVWNVQIAVCSGVMLAVKLPLVMAIEVVAFSFELKFVKCETLKT